MEYHDAGRINNLITWIRTTMPAIQLMKIVNTDCEICAHHSKEAADAAIKVRDHTVGLVNRENDLRARAIRLNKKEKPAYEDFVALATEIEEFRKDLRRVDTEEKALRIQIDEIITEP